MAKTDESTATVTEEPISGLDTLLGLVQEGTMEEVESLPRGGGGGGTRRSKWNEVLNYVLNKTDENGAPLKVFKIPASDTSDPTITTVAGGLAQARRRYKKEHGSEAPVEVKMSRQASVVMIVRTDV